MQIDRYIPTKTYNYTDLLRDAVIFLCLMSFFFVVAYFLAPEKVLSSNWIVPALFFLMHIFGKTSSDRLQQPTFDTLNKEVIISYKSMFSDVKQKRVSFEMAKLEVVKAKSKQKEKEPVTIYVMKEKREVFEIERIKDCLTGEILQAIVETAERHRIPIINK